MLSGKITKHEEPKKSSYVTYPQGGALWDDDWQSAFYGRQKSITEIYIDIEAQTKIAESAGFKIGSIVMRSHGGRSTGTVKKFGNTMQETVDANDDINVIGVLWDNQSSNELIYYKPDELVIVGEE